MRPWELFQLIKETEYEKTGDDVDFKVLKIDGRAILLFEESTTKRDWQINFNFPRKLYKKQQRWLFVHRGYGNAWKSANDKIMKYFIQAVNETDKMPLIAGWSFGGAMAQLAAEDFNFRTGKRAEVVTFGSPKVAGDYRTANTIFESGKFAQYANVNDIVPLCPPLPFFHSIDKVKCGGPFRIKELFNPQVHHQNYGNKDIYRGEE